MSDSTVGVDFDDPEAVVAPQTDAVLAAVERERNAPVVDAVEAVREATGSGGE